MNHQIVRVITRIEYALGTVLLVLALYLLASPLRSAANDAHNAMLGVFSGLILLSFSAAVFIAARAMLRGGRRHWIEQFGVIILCAGLFALIGLSRSLLL